MGKAIGIDLGTTNSCAAIFENGRPRLITYKGGETTIPSVFAIDEQGNRLVGHEAKRQAQLNPSNTVYGAKRLMGRNYHSKTIDKIRQVFTYELREGEQSEVLIKVKDQIFTLEQISAAILRKIKEVAEESLGEQVDQAVITVPAYFNDRQRQAVRTAGVFAGLKVLRVLNEPTAAALAYGLGRNLESRVAVYDLGGGTFDISVIDIKDRIFEVVATGGDTFLGGMDFDDRVMQKILEDFYKKHNIDLSINRVAIQRIRDAAETAKISLSEVSSYTIEIPAITTTEEGSFNINITITRDTLNEWCMDLVDRTIATCTRIIKEAGCTVKDVDEMLLVGGQSRMPLVQQKVTEFIGKAPSKGVNPDEAVAIGAAMMAHSLSSSSSEPENSLTLLDVLPMPIGINKVDGTMHVLFNKNQPLPDYKTRTLTTSKDNQRSIMLRLYQGDSKMCDENEQLGTFIFSGIRPAPKGQVQIEVTFHIDSEGILNLTAKDKATGQTVQQTLQMGGNITPGGKSSKVKTAASKPKKPAAKPGVAPSPLMMGSSLANSVAPAGGEDPPSDVSDVPSEPQAVTAEDTAAAAEPTATAPKAPAPAASTTPTTPSTAVTPVKPPEKKGFWAWLKSLFGLG